MSIRLTTRASALARELAAEFDSHKELAHSLACDVHTTLARTHVRELALALTRARDVALDLYSTLEGAARDDSAHTLALELARAGELARDVIRRLGRDLDSTLAVGRDIDGTRTLDVDAARDVALSLANTREWAYDLANNLPALAFNLALDIKRAQSITGDAIQKPSPPALAESLLARLASSPEAALGDFLELYERRFIGKVSKLGCFFAKLDYCWRVLCSAPGFLEIRIRRGRTKTAERTRRAR